MKRKRMEIVDAGIEEKSPVTPCIRCGCTKRVFTRSKVERDGILPVGGGKFVKGYRMITYRCKQCPQMQVVRVPLGNVGEEE